MPRSAKQCLALFLIAIGLTVAGGAQPPTEARADDLATPKKKGVGDFNEITPELRRAVNEGLDFLADGINASSTGGAPSRSYPVAVTALAGLAFLANGETPTRGPHAAALKRCLNYIVTHADDRTGVIFPRSNRGHGLMYSHGFATLFLAEAYGTTRSRRVRIALRKAVRLIEDSQGDGGGWSYQPVKQTRYDMSVGVCQTMALRAARNAGVAVSPVVVERAIQCAVNARSRAEIKPNDHNQTSGFCYTSTRPGRGRPTWAVTSGALCILYGLGRDKDTGETTPEKNPSLLIKPALRYIMQTAGTNQLKRGQMPGQGHMFYANYYSVQAMVHAGGEEYWGAWFPGLRDALLKIRRGNHWSDGVGDHYATAMACLILSVPYQYLPTFEN